MRNLTAALLSSLCLVSSPAWARPDRDAGPLHVDFQVDASDAKAPLAAGAMDLEPFQTTRYEADGPGAVSALKLELFARPQRDGTVAIEIALDERDRDGRVVKWQPDMQGKRGVPLSATIRSGDVSRTIRVTVR